MLDDVYDLLDENPKEEGEKRKKKSDFLIRKQDFMLYKRLELLLDPYVEVLLDKFIDTKAPFGILLFYAEGGVLNIESFLHQLKRESDLLIRLEEDQNAYILLCQDTTKEGMFAFTKRVINASSSLDFQELHKTFLPRLSLIVFETKSLSKNYVYYLIMRDFLLMKEHDKVLAKVDVF